MTIDTPTDLPTAGTDAAPTLAIGELARQAGTTTSAIRYYEERGLIEPAGRESGRRRFRPSAVRRLWLIELCTRAGFSLDETRVLLTDRARRRGQRRTSRALAERKLAEIDEQITRLRAAQDLIGIGLRCTCPSLEDCACDADVWCLLTA